MKKLFLSHSDIIHLTHEVIKECVRDKFVFDAVVAPARGGLVVGNYISQYFDVPLIALNKGYELYDLPNEINILVVDDINDTGATFNKLEADFVAAGFSPQTRKYAALIDNESSSFVTDYVGRIINKAVDNCWVVFPWEEWWKIKVN